MLKPVRLHETLPAKIIRSNNVLYTHNKPNKKEGLIVDSWSKMEKDQDRACATKRQLLPQEFDLNLKRKCSEEGRLRRPFLTLNTPHAKNWLSVKSLDGHFAIDEQVGLVFIAKINSSAKASLPCMDDYSDSLTPLLQMLCIAEHSIICCISLSIQEITASAICFIPLPEGCAPS